MRGARKIGPPKLEFFHVGALPLVNHFLRRLRLAEILGSYLSTADRRRQLAPAQALMVMVRNLLVCREPLYAVRAWAAKFEPSLLSLSPQEVPLLNDDRVGRSLVDLFDADRPSLVLRVVVQAIREFKLRLERFHNDTTSISFHGLYRLADGRRRRGKKTLKITYGHSKDHRPDLRQLLWSLTVTADGAVPVNYEVLDGNITDDQIHRQTWDVLCTLVGGPKFLYVADSKLCTRPNMLHIAQKGGRFLTVLQATRKEDGRFRDWIQSHEVPWNEVLRKPIPGRKRHPPEIIRAYEDPAGSSEGFRIVWFHSTEKEKRDLKEREEKLDRAIRELQDLNDRLASVRTRLRRREKVDKAVEGILGSAGAARWLDVHVERKEEKNFRQAKPGRPGPNTPYRRKTRLRFSLSWTAKKEALDYDRKIDGIFPLITNVKKMALRAILQAYKLGQPPVEQRHHNLKAFHQVAPQYLKSVVRIEAFLCVYFLALLLNALIEREVHAGMKRHHLKSLALYPEDRPCKRPTTEQLLRVFDDLMVHCLHGRAGAKAYVYPPTLNRLQRRILRVLGIPLDAYRFA